VDCHKAGGSRENQLSICALSQTTKDQSSSAELKNPQPRISFAVRYMLLFHNAGPTAKHLQLSFM
jgi:hypothetical protein